MILLAGYSSTTLALLAAIAFVAGLARGFSGFGAALIFVPLASAVMAPQVAAPLLLAIDGVSSLGLIPRAWGRANKRDVGTMAMGALVGVPLGAFLLTQLDPVTVRWGIAVLTGALLALLVSGWRYRGRPAVPVTVGVGGVAGIFSGLAQVGGPPVVAYWLGGTLASDTVRANIVLYFLITTTLTAASYLVGGLLTGLVLTLALITGPAYAAGLFIGSRMFDRASEATFRRICYALIAAAALLSLPILDGVIR